MTGFQPLLKIHLIAPAELNDEDFEKFKSSLRTVMQYIHYTAEGNEKLLAMANEGKFDIVDTKAAMVLSACTKSEFIIDESKEVFNVCQAIIDIRKDGVAEGISEGITRAIKAMMANLNLTVEQAVSAAGVPENERDAYISKLQNPSA